MIPSTLATCGAWLAEHSDTTLRGNDTGVYHAESYRSESDSGSVYSSYRNA